MSGGRAARAKGLAAVVGLALVAVVLSACGARIDTQLSVDSAGAGTRVMTLTLEGNQDDLRGGVAAVDASILRHKPAELDYSGLTTGPDGELVATFTVSFADPEEYTQKMVALLAASDQQWAQENSFVVEQSRFLQGATIGEQFDSQDLLQWMFAGLLVDGVVDQGNSGDMYELGSTTVTFDGVAYEANNQISFSKLVDNGFDSVEMSTTFDGEGFAREITYWIDDKAVYNSATDAFDGFFAEVEASGASVEKSAEEIGVTWVASLSAASAPQLVELTNAALLSEETAFTVTTGTVEKDPATATISIVDYADCSAICSPDAAPITEALSVPAAYQLVSGGEQNEEGQVVFAMSSTGAEQQFNAVYAFTSVTTELSIGITGGVTWSGDFVADSADATTVGDGFESLLAPSDGTGTIDVATGDGSTVYTVTIEGASADEFVDAYRAWSGDEGTSLSLADAPGANLVSVNYRISGSLGLSAVVASHVAAEAVRQNIVLPFGQNFDTAAGVMPVSAAIDGSRLAIDGQGVAAFSALVSGTSLAGFVIYAVLLLVVLVAVLLVLLFRTRIMAAIARRRQASAERQAGAERHAVAAQSAPGAALSEETPGETRAAVSVPAERVAVGWDDVDAL